MGQTTHSEDLPMNNDPEEVEIEETDKSAELEWDIDAEVDDNLAAFGVEFVRFESTWYDDESHLSSDIQVFGSNGELIELPWDGKEDLEEFYWNNVMGGDDGVYEYHVPTRSVTHLADTLQEEVWGTDAFEEVGPPKSIGEPLEGAEFRLLASVKEDLAVKSYPEVAEGKEMIQLNLGQLVEIGEAAKYLIEWGKVTMFMAMCYPVSAVKAELEIDWEYNDEGGNDPRISYVEVKDAEGEDLNPDYEKMWLAYDSIMSGEGSGYRDYDDVQSLIDDGDYGIRQVMIEAFKVETPSETTIYDLNNAPKMPFAETFYYVKGE